MQTKKVEVRERLIAVGLEHFSAEGFEKASLRKIVKDAGTTLGNYYNYFLNKEALFEAIVDESYRGFELFLQQHKEEEKTEASAEITPEVLAGAEEVLEAQIKALVPFLTPAFLLLIEGSKGTRYESFRGGIVDFFAGHYSEHLQSQGIDDPYDYGKVAGDMFVSGLIQIVRRTSSTTELVESMRHHFLFFVYGTVGMIGMEEKRLTDD